MKIFLIGGMGFLGSHILGHLAGKGYDVTVLTRSTNKAALLQDQGIHPVTGDLQNADSFLDQLSKQDAVVSVAMPHFVPGRMSATKFSELTSQTTAYFSSTLAAARKCSCPLILTLGTSFRTKGDEVADETWPIDRFGMTEIGRHVDTLIEQAEKAGTPPIIQMLPGEIYGPGGLFKNFMYRWMKSGKYRVIGSGDNFLPRVHVEDCARAYVKVLEKMPLGERFILADDLPCTLREFSDFMADTMNTPRPGSLPRFLVRLAMGKRILQTVTMNCKVSNSKARSMLDWKLSYPTYREGLPATIAALENEQAATG